MEKIKRITNFRNLGLGFFLHWGIYNKVGKGEWFGNMYNLNTEQYYKEIGDLNQIEIKLNIPQIVQTAKANGFKYIVLTSKHHDGFSLFDSKGISEFDITKTNTKQDIIKDFIKECQNNGIKPIIYYCTMDWSWDELGISFEDQLIKINQAIELLCKTYPDIEGFWFDGNWSRKEADWKENILYKLIRSYIPEAIIINNSGLTNAGKEQNIEIDSLTFEQGHLTTIDYSNFKRDLAAEVCQSFNDHWGIAYEDYNYKSLSYLILKFVQSRREKANYLLNVSLDGDGNMQPIEIETIKLFHKWVEKYGYMFFEEYDVLSKNKQDFIIKTKNNKSYVFIYNLPSGGHVKVIQKGGKIQPNREFKLNTSLNNITNIIFLDNNESIDFIQTNNKLIITPTAFNYGFNTLVRVGKIK